MATAVVAYDKKGTMAYIDSRQRQQPTTVAAAAYIDGRQRQWPTSTMAELIMTKSVKILASASKKDIANGW
jgi:hypothetical protein